MIRFFFTTLAAVALSACPPSPSPPTPDSGDSGVPPLGDAGATDCKLICARLAIVGCVEGKDEKCVPTCMHVQRSQITTFPIACLSAARTKAEVHACGSSVECP